MVKAIRNLSGQQLLLLTRETPVPAVLAVAVAD